MRGVDPALHTHLKTGATTICRCWKLRRKDGLELGFTDHDRDLTLDGVLYRADSGLTGSAIQASTGLSVDNSQAIGALRHAGIEEGDINAGRFDGAAVEIWLVNWANPVQTLLQFRGTIGEIQYSGGYFEAELRGLSEALNQPQGRVYHRKCSAVLGDGCCGVDLNVAGYFAMVNDVHGVNDFTFDSLESYGERWFEKGVLRVKTGAAAGLVGIIRADRIVDGQRQIELWQDLAIAIETGDQLRLEAGCDKRVETCRFKFNNFLNFRGFPHIPGEDWAMSYPVSSGINDGGRRG